MNCRLLLIGLLVASLGATTATTMPTTRSSSSSSNSSSRRSGYSDRYGLLEDRNIFVRERSSRRSGGRSTTSSTQPSTPKTPEERMVLTGIVFEEDGFRAYVENDQLESMRLAPGDKIARGRVAAIVIDAIAYEPTPAGGSSSATTQQATTQQATTQSSSTSPTPAQRVWVEIGCDLTGKPSSMLASSYSSSPSASATTSPTTGPVIASDVAGLNPNDPNLSAEQRMKLRRAMELQKK